MIAKRTTKLTPFAKILRECRNDKVRFFREVLEIEPHEGQRIWLAHPQRAEGVLVTGNRFGKTFVAAGDIIHACATMEGWTPETASKMAAKHECFHAINTSITASQARLVWDKANAMLKSRKASWLVKSALLTPFPKITFINGSVLECRSIARDGEHLLGFSYDRINFDEAAFARHFNLIRENVLLNRVLDRAGRITYTSTGNGRNEFGLFFLKALQGKDPGVYGQTGSTLQNPNIDRGRLEQNIARMSARMVAQTINGAIVDGGGDFFNQEDLESAYDPALDLIARVHSRDDEDEVSHVELFPGQTEEGEGGKSWRDTYPNHKYLSGWDLADKQDYTVGLTFDVTTVPATLVEFERFRRLGWSNVYARMYRREMKYGRGTTKFDMTGVGDVVADGLRAAYPDMRAEGVNFAGGRKDVMLEALKTSLSFHDFRWPSIPPMQSELSYYERDDDGLKTDCVMALGVFRYFFKRPLASFSLGTVDTGRRLPVDAREIALGLVKAAAAPSYRPAPSDLANHGLPGDDAYAKPEKPTVETAPPARIVVIRPQS